MLNALKKKPLSPFVSMFIIIFLFTGSPLFSEDKRPDYWPTASWRNATPESQGVDSRRLVEMLHYVLENHYSIDSITIVRNGYMVMDAYFYPFDKNTKHEISSCTKSFTSALLGIAVDKGFIPNVHQPVVDFFPDRSVKHLDDLKRAVTLEHLLTMTSGLNPDDPAEKRMGLNEILTLEDWTQVILDRPMAEAPGRGFKYNNGGSYLLSAVIQGATKMRTIDFAERYLFTPMGIRDWEWATCPKGIAIGGSKMRLKPKDMAKFGWLYLNKGRWSDRQLVPETWVETSILGHVPVIGGALLFDQYGYQWWGNSKGYYAAWGAGGQFIFVVPPKKMVVVFTCNLSDHYGHIPGHLLNTYILPSAISSTPLPANPEKSSQLNALIERCARGPKK